MIAAKQPALDFGVHPLDQKREDFPFGAAEARREAHQSQSPSRKEKTWGRIMAYAKQHPEGFTADQLAAEWRVSHNHVAPRVSELVDLGRLVITGERRATRSGHSAAVVKVNNG